MNVIFHLISAFGFGLLMFLLAQYRQQILFMRKLLCSRQNVAPFIENPIAFLKKFSSTFNIPFEIQANSLSMAHQHPQPLRPDSLFLACQKFPIHLMVLRGPPSQNNQPETELMLEIHLTSQQPIAEKLRQDLRTALGPRIKATIVLDG